MQKYRVKTIAVNAALLVFVLWVAQSDLYVHPLVMIALIVAVNIVLAIIE